MSTSTERRSISSAGKAPAPVADEDDAVWLAEQLKLDFEPQRDEHITCFPLAEINNLNDTPTLSARPIDPEDEP